MALSEAQIKAHKKYRETHIEETKALNRKHQKTWYENHKELHREKMREYQRRRRAMLKSGDP